MSLYDRYETDKVSEADGVWVPYEDGVELCLARAGGANLPYVRATEKFARKFKRELDAKTLTTDQTRPVFMQVYADTVVKAWKGVKNKAGKAMEFNRRNCLKLFEELPEFFERVQEDAQDLEHYKTANLEFDSKNLSTSSSTPSE